MKILMIGTGYVGLVTGTCFSEMGHQVICLDIDNEKIEKLKKGDIPIYEPGLKDLVNRNMKADRLFFTTDYQYGIEQSDVLFIAVPTPSSEDGSCNTQYIKRVSIAIAKHLTSYRLIVNKSTSPIGTASLIRKTIQDNLSQEVSFDVASNPEFLKEGSAISDCMKPDRVVIGCDSPKAENLLKDIYAPFVFKRDRIISMDIPSAEMTKYAANAMLALRISFMNELSEICKQLGANINSIRKGIGSDSRIGYSFLYAGVGYGGSCFPKDIRALISQAKKYEFDPKLLQAIEFVNEIQKKTMGRLIENYFTSKGGLKGKTITIWGLSFKPDTDDIREAPALTLIEELHEKGTFLRIYDPVAMENTKQQLKGLANIEFCKNEFDAAIGSHAICLMTEWKQFRLVDFGSISKQMKTLAFFDGRNQYKAQDLTLQGFDYIAIGTPNLHPPKVWN